MSDSEIVQGFGAVGEPSNALPTLIQQIKELACIQLGECGDGDPYMRGLFNGLELALAVLEDRDPVYVSAPDAAASAVAASSDAKPALAALTCAGDLGNPLHGSASLLVR